MKKENHLSGESSPYLLQHLYNPVDWYPWGDEAFARAREEDRPVFLSIGYSTCHWCHVMERESFENDEVATILNGSFIAVKVDREERPDIDKVYMAACQMMTGTGGWPLTILMTPDKKPFFAGTYIPRESGGGTGLIDLLLRVKSLWKDRRAAVLESAESAAAALGGTARDAGAGGAVDDITGRAFQAFSRNYDLVEGGFGGAPKFPSPHNLLFMLRYWRESGVEAARTMALETLEKMSRGGIYDHLGYGFHRYSTDARWLVPHFEKMLYDQAMMALALAEAYLAGGGSFASTLREIFQYVLRDMTSPEGGFYSAEDADSEGKEGAFYLWTMKEIRDILGGEDAEFAAGIFNLTDEGNYFDTAVGRKTGENIPHRAGETGDPARLESVRARLLAARVLRPRPLRDDKVLTDWNGLMIAALAAGARALGEKAYLDAAARAAAFMEKEMLREGDLLLHRYRGGDAGIPGNLDDYAFFTWGLVELYEAGFDTRHLDLALRLSGAMLKYFSAGRGGLRFSPDHGERLIARTVEYYDGAYPSGNSVAFYALSRLARITGDPAWEDAAREILAGALPGLRDQPHGHGMLLAGLMTAQKESCEIVLTGDGEHVGEMLGALRRHYLPGCVILVKDPAVEGPSLESLAPFTAAMSAPASGAAAYMCRNRACNRPVRTTGELFDLLGIKSA
jgi:uncharacterized protein